MPVPVPTISPVPMPPPGADSPDLFLPVLGAVLILVLLVRGLRWAWGNQPSLLEETREGIRKIERFLGGKE